MDDGFSAKRNSECLTVGGSKTLNDEPRSSFPWPSLVALLAYLVVLCGVGVFGPASAGTSIWELQDSAQLRDWLVRVAWGGVFETLRFLPVGFLSWLVVTGWLPSLRAPATDGEAPAGGWPERALAACGQLLLAAAVAVALAAFVRAVELRRPAPLALLLLPAAGCVFGVWFSRGWCRGGGSRRWLAHQFVLLMAASFAGVVGLAILAVDHTPLPFDPAEVTTAQKRQLVAAIRGSEVPGTDLRRLELTDGDLNFLLAWGLTLGSANRKARVFFGEELVVAEASLGIPAAGRHWYLNARAAGRVEVLQGQPRVRVEHLQLGQLRVPAAVANLIAPLLLEALQKDPEAGPMLASILELRVDSSGLQLAARQGDFTRRVLPKLAVRLGAKPDVRSATAEHLWHLASAAADFPPGDAGFTASLQAAFGFAHQRSHEDSAVLENTAAIFALGILLGHPRVERLVGPITDDQLRELLRENMGRVSVRGRFDWVQHFWVSAAVALISSEAASNAVGLLKEELDAGGGSGFSFSDLLADRAGTLFALAATQDEAAARQMQQRLAVGLDLGDLFPPAADLPEGISDRRLREVYGGVGGPRYTEVLVEIERRLAACPALHAPGDAG